MRAILFVTAACVGALVWAGSGQAADAPNASQIINSLTPNGNMTTRGIRLGGQPPAVERPATPASTGGMARPVPTQSATGSGEANLNVPFASGSSEISPSAARVLDQ